MRKSKGESSSVSMEDNRALSGVLTRSQARRLSTQVLKSKETKLSPVKSFNKSPSKNSPKAQLSACKQADSVESPEIKKQATSECFSPKKKNVGGDRSPKVSVSSSNQKTLSSKKTKHKPNASEDEMSKEVKNSPRPLPNDINFIVEEVDGEDKTHLFVDVKSIKTLSSKKEKRKLQPSEIEPEADVKEEVFSDISNEVEPGVNKIKKYVPIIENIKEDVDSDDSANLKKETVNKVALTANPSVVVSNETSPSRKVSKDSVSPHKEKLLKKKAVIEDNSESDEDSDAESRKEIMRSAEKRIIRNISTSESESRNVNSFKMSNIRKDSTDSDSAPEDITFEASRKSAMDLLRHTVDSIKRDKQKKKEKRKERLELLRQQKEDNLIRLKERKANLEDASCSSSEESTHEKNGLDTVGISWLSKGKKTYFEEETEGKKSATVNKSLESSMSVSVGLTSSQNGGLKRLPSDLLENLSDRLPKKMKIAHGLKTDSLLLQSEKRDNPRSSGIKNSRDIDFRPLQSSSSTQFGVVTLNTQKLKTVAQQAADFRQNMLYGNRVQRVPANTHIKNRHKRQVLQS